MKDCLRALCEALGTAHLDSSIEITDPEYWRSYGASVSRFEEQLRDERTELRKVNAELGVSNVDLRCHVRALTDAAVVQMDSYGDSKYECTLCGGKWIDPDAPEHDEDMCPVPAAMEALK